ncbi:hypothetical protein ART_0533 [Arthrobacter sp. PAMC 25486]|nr:hypothetical protein ART_0533 [Arthrobacter sp. PAMC 25486]
MVAAMARAMEWIGLVSTGSSTFYEPCHAARMLASLDHISGGRAGVNIVTSMFDAEARDPGLPALPPHQEHYSRAAEFSDVTLALWTSWVGGTLMRDRQGQFADPVPISALLHAGEHSTVEGPLNVPRFPQGHPVTFQAVASEPGRRLAASYAEGIYAVAYDLTSAHEYYGDVKRRISGAGRDPDKVAIMPGPVTYIGRTEAGARAKQAAVDAFLPKEMSLAQLGRFVQCDTSGWELDAPCPCSCRRRTSPDRSAATPPSCGSSRRGGPQCASSWAGRLPAEGTPPWRAAPRRWQLKCSGGLRVEAPMGST